MSNPKRQHFLPQAGYLRFFSIGGRGEKIVVYPRGARTFITSLVNAGVEKDLYSLVDAQGRLNRDLERLVLSALDGKAASLMERLNSEKNLIELDRMEIETLYEMVAVAYLRTPSFRDGFRKHGSDVIESGEIERFVDQDLANLGLSADRIDSCIRTALDNIRTTAAHRNYWLVRVGRLIELALPELASKRAEILETDEIVITCDHPVAIDYGAGIRGSDLVFPIGSHRVLVMRCISGRLVDNSRIPVRTIGRAQARELNRQTMRMAERTLFASIERAEIKQLFDRMAAPQRMRFVPESNRASTG